MSFQSSFTEMPFTNKPGALHNQEVYELEMCRTKVSLRTKYIVFRKKYIQNLPMSLGFDTNLMPLSNGVNFFMSLDNLNYVSISSNCLFPASVLWWRFFFISLSISCSSQSDVPPTAARFYLRYARIFWHTTGKSLYHIAAWPPWRWQIINGVLWSLCLIS